MFNRIQRDPAQHARGRVAAAVRHPGVRRLVKADGKQKCNQLKYIIHMLQCHAGLDSILTRKKATSRRPAWPCGATANLWHPAKASPSLCAILREQWTSP